MSTLSSKMFKYTFVANTVEVYSQIFSLFHSRVARMFPIALTILPDSSPVGQMLRCFLVAVLCYLCPRGPSVAAA